MDPPQVGDIVRIDAAMRVLADRVADWPVEALPQVIGAYIDHGSLTFMLAEPAGRPPSPFQADDNGWWRLDANTPLPAVPNNTLAPLPSLVTVGGQSGRHILLDLDYLRGMAISGDPTAAVDLLRYMVIELVNNIWADDLRITLAGFDRIDARNIRSADPGRIRIAPSVPEAIDHYAARLRRPLDQAEPNHVLVIAKPDARDTDLINALDDELNATAGTGISMIVAAAPGALRLRHQISVNRGGVLDVAMVMPDLFEDVAVLLHPTPIPPTNLTDTEQEVIDQQHEQVIRERQDTIARLRKVWDTTDADPLLRALADQTHIRDEADARIRQLVAYAREFVFPKPYSLESLAEIIGGSPSAIRGVYDHRDVEEVAEATRRRSTVPQVPATDRAARDKLIDELAARTADGPVRDQVPGVAAALADHGWTPYAPVRRTANPKYAKHYVRWERRWPNGTVISLYQEPSGWLGVYARMPENNPRWFSRQYGVIDIDDGKPITASDIHDALTAYDVAVTRHDAEATASTNRSLV